MADPIFSAKNFKRLPVKLIADVLEHEQKAFQFRTNAASVSTAKLATVVVSALGGKGTKMKLDHFLPYELEGDNSGLKSSTKEALRWALKNEKMPAAIVGMIGAELS